MGGPPHFDVKTEKGIAELDSFLQTRSYIDGWKYGNADKECFELFAVSPNAEKYPHAFRWYLHIASLQGVQFIPAPTVSPLKKEIEDLFADRSDMKLPPRESRADMMARVKKEVRASMAKRK